MSEQFERYVLPGSTAGSSIPGPPSGFVPEEPRGSYIPAPPSPVQPPRYPTERPLAQGMELVGPRTVEQLSKDYADLVRNARRVEGELLQTKTNLESCGLERNVARNEAKTCAAGYEDATQRGIAIERRAMLCQEQIEKCRELQRDYDTVVGENEYLKSEIQRLISGQPRQTLPLQSYERRLPPPPEKSGYRKSRRPLPPPESPVCVIL